MTVSALHVCAQLFPRLCPKRKGKSSTWNLLPAGRELSTPAQSIPMPSLFSLFLPTRCLLLLTPHLALNIFSHTKIIFILPLSQPPTHSHEGPVRGCTSMCAIFWCDICHMHARVRRAVLMFVHTSAHTSKCTAVKRSKCISIALGFHCSPYGGGLEIP